MSENIEIKKTDHIFMFCSILLGIIVFVVVIGALAFDSNSSKKFEILENQITENIGGELNIVSMDSYVGSSDSETVQGCFVLFSGTYEGKTETMIRFSWQSNDGFSYLYEVPSSLFQRIPSTDNQLKVNFNLNFDSNRNDLPSKVGPLDYNNIIKNSSKGVTLSMTDEQYAQFLKITYSNPIS